jgi:hypothetical protein
MAKRLELVGQKRCDQCSRNQCNSLPYPLCPTEERRTASGRHSVDRLWKIIFRSRRCRPLVFCLANRMKRADSKNTLCINSVTNMKQLLPIGPRVSGSSPKELWRGASEGSLRARVRCRAAAATRLFESSQKSVSAFTSSSSLIQILRNRTSWPSACSLRPSRVSVMPRPPSRSPSTPELGPPQTWLMG